MYRVNNFETTEELIELTRHENERVRLKATQQMCPCRVKYDEPAFWERLFELAEDEDDAVRAQVLHNMCDGSPPGYEDKVFYVWFDAPIGYISITANYTDEWQQWWMNESEVELYQFMGKDNITFHTVIFPSTLIGTGQPWTKLHHISTTEYLNYEKDAAGHALKFSKSRGTGVFGDNVIELGIPSEVWRYYLLANRPENQDTIFLWSDFIARNNNELLANLGNFSNRALKFTKAAFAGAVPAYPGE